MTHKGQLKDKQDGGEKNDKAEPVSSLPSITDDREFFFDITKDNDFFLFCPDCRIYGVEAIDLNLAVKNWNALKKAKDGSVFYEC